MLDIKLILQCFTPLNETFETFCTSNFMTKMSHNHKSVVLTNVYYISQLKLSIFIMVN
jgi:hypothetical protein